jgi:hypothetical protein
MTMAKFDPGRGAATPWIVPKYRENRGAICR